MGRMMKADTVTRTALVTGSGRNIGRAVALALAGQGCNVVVNGSSNLAACEAVAGEVEDLGARALVAMGDIGDRNAAREICRAGAGAFDRIDVLVNNAAIRPLKPFLETSDDDWHRVLDVDLNAAFYTCHEVLPGMVDNGWGRIINLTGMNAIHGYKGRVPVSVAKHGLWGLTKALAKEFGSSGITVNAISPGPIRSEHDDAELARHIQDQVGRIPLGHLGEPDHIASLCAYLVSDAGGFVTGQMVACNGGAET